jgi:hypothetical protein
MESNYLRNTSNNNNNNNNNTSIKIYIKKRLVDDDTIVVSSLCKRKLVDAFGAEIYNEKERYGQEIPDDFFILNSGHGIYN